MKKRKNYFAVGAFFLVLAGLCVGFKDDDKALLYIGTVELSLVAAVVTMFVIVYAHRNWRANPYGRALMYSKMSLAILSNFIVISLLFGSDFPGREYLRNFLYGGLIVAQARLLQLLFLTRNEKGREDYALEEEIKKAVSKE